MNKNQNNENLNRFAINLCERAREGKLDPVIGRDDEIRRVLQILSRRTKNNPILIGEPGVGKTAIAEGLEAEGVLPGGPKVWHTVLCVEMCQRTLNRNKFTLWIWAHSLPEQSTKENLKSV